MTSDFKDKRSLFPYNNPNPTLQKGGDFFEIQKAGEKEDENWLNTRAASAYLGITPNALRIRVHRGQIEAFKFRTHLRFLKTSLKMLLSKKEY